jgi:hypothetical protein
VVVSIFNAIMLEVHMRDGGRLIKRTRVVPICDPRRKRVVVTRRGLITAGRRILLVLLSNLSVHFKLKVI